MKTRPVTVATTLAIAMRRELKTAGPTSLTVRKVWTLAAAHRRAVTSLDFQRTKIVCTLRFRRTAA